MTIQLQDRPKLMGIILTLLILAFAVASADARPSTKSYSCSGVKNLVKKRGAVVMNYKGQYVYERFVSSRRYCQPGEILDFKTVPAKDGRCRLKICIEPIYDDF